MAPAIPPVANTIPPVAGRTGAGGSRPGTIADREDPAGKVRLLLVTVGLGVGGTEGQLLELASRLDPLRYAVTVCALKGPDVIAREMEARGIRVVTLGGGWAWDPRVLLRLWRLVRAERPDIIHSFLFWANVAGRVVGRLSATPLVISSYRAVPLWAGWYRRRVDRLTIRWADAATCCSDAVRRQALRALGGNPGRYVTIHNGVDLIRFSTRAAASRSELGLPSEGPVIGTIGRLVEPKKGLTVLLEGLTEVLGRPAAPTCHLVIVGEGPARERLQAMAARLRIERHVTFAGVRRDVAGALSLMDVFVMPSLHEGFGIAVIEAMAAGKPVVATRVGGIVEVVDDGETGVLVEPGDPAGLAVAVLALLRNPERARRMGALGRKRAEQHFSIERCVSRHAGLYESLLAVRGGGDGATVPDARSRPAGPVENPCSSLR